MDVILKPLSPGAQAWSLTDPLGRTLGCIKRGVDFEIIVDSTGRLNGIRHHFDTLDAAMTGIAVHMKGACSLVKVDAA